MVNDFFDGPEHEGNFGHIMGEYLSAKEEGSLSSLNFNEEEFEYLIDKLIEEGKDEEVLLVSQIAFERFPYSSMILARFCDTLILMGNPDKALEILNSYADSFTAESSINMLFARANIAKKQYVHAREYFYKALEYSPVISDSVESTCALAQDCIDVGNYTEALYYLEKASTMAPLPYEYNNDYAFCYDKLDEPEKSLVYYNRYLDSNPFNDTVWFNIGTVYARLREFDNAIEAFEYSIALNPANSSSLYNLAVVYMNLQRYREAADTFAEFVKVDSDVLGKLGLGEAYVRLERFDEAVKLFEEIKGLGESGIEGESGLDAVKAIILCRNGDFEAFKKLFLKLLDAGTAWLAVVYDMLPFLQGEGWFLEFLESIKK